MRGTATRDCTGIDFRNSTRHAECRGMQKLVDVLAFDGASSKELEHSLLLVHGQLTTQEKKMEALSAGCVPACTALLAHETPEVRGNAALVLSALAPQLQARWGMQRSKTPEALAPLLRDGDGRVARAAAAALSSLCMVQDGAGVVFEAEGVVGAMVSALEVYPWPALSLANFVPWYSDFGQAAVKAGAVAALLKVLQNTAAPEVALRRACSALRCLATTPEGKEACTDLRAVEVLVPLLVHVCPKVRCAANGTLPLLAAGSLNSFPQFAELGARGVAAVCGRLADDDERVRTNARQGVLHFAKDPELCKRLAHFTLENLGWEAFLHVFGTGCAHALVTALAFPAGSVVASQAARAAYEFLGEPGGPAALAAAQHITPTLLFAAVAAADGGATLAVRDVAASQAQAAAYAAEGSASHAGAGADTDPTPAPSAPEQGSEDVASLCCAVLVELAHRFGDVASALTGTVQGSAFDGSAAVAEDLRQRLPTLLSSPAGADLAALLLPPADAEHEDSDAEP